MNFSFLRHSEENHDVAEALALLRKESLDIFNRLHSIAEDIKFVADVCNEYSYLPVMRECSHLQPSSHH